MVLQSSYFFIKKLHDSYCISITYSDTSRIPEYNKSLFDNRLTTAGNNQQQQTRQTDRKNRHI
ncbi:hypothetical protein BACCOPRO_03687 [Phocaeicola coprophilus DSM 18228 = JCM 13818]|uniref:Uncharacterized protein n=1 Tax=Phocaeicola coprophilus DSM 18228 = JCM 13818 TaxID=547042 RepID=S0FDT7_9BACT|nr:hypothetical protein BACCOPRO_03687 [Phocaeicola coprophilus DSM 18228 = JCM 13818]